MMDRVIWAYGMEQGLDFTLFRPFNWIGAGLDSINTPKEGSSRVITQFLGQIVRGEPIKLVDGEMCIRDRGVTNGSDRVLTVSATSLGPNRTTNGQMCLRDVNFTPLPATEIRYDIGSTGPAKVTVNDVEGNKGKVLTGEEGCATVKITSSGQIPGGLPIDLNFTSDFVAAPIKVTIKSPGAGKMDGLFNCEFAFDRGTGTCKGTLRLTDDEGSPLSLIHI